MSYKRITIFVQTLFKLLVFNLKATAYPLLILSINILQPLFAADNLLQNNKIPCEFKSELVPNVTLRHLPKLNNIALSTNRYQLIYKGKPIKDFSFTQYQGYGTHMWWHVNAISNNTKGGERIFFRGNYPVRGATEKNQLKGEFKMLLVGLGADLYYTGFRIKQRELVTAANGFWLVPSQCLPRYP